MIFCRLHGRATGNWQNGRYLDQKIATNDGQMATLSSAAAQLLAVFLIISDNAIVIFMGKKATVSQHIVSQRIAKP